MRRLADACREACEAAEPPRGLEAVLRLARDAAGAERAFLLEEAPGPSRARIVAWVTARGDATPTFSRGVATRALRGERPLLWPDREGAATHVEDASVRSLALRAVVAVPLPRSGRRRFAVVLDSREALTVGRHDLERLGRAFASLLSLLLRTGAGPVRPTASPPPVLVGRSPSFLRLLDDARLAARVPLPALVVGESGTGKELVARVLHDDGPRRGRPFVAINCSAIPEGLLERELFGATRGAYTGADRDHVGLFRQAEGGTIFLDEIGDMPMALQAKLLRVLQDGSVRAVGDVHERQVDVRVVAATHRDLRALVAEGRFRADLRYRLAFLLIRVPALRERPGDISLLAEHLLHRLADRCGMSSASLDREASALLAGHAWPGNVRELEATLARALVRTEGGVIRSTDLEIDLADASTGKPTGGGRPALERAMIDAAVREARGNLTAAAERIGWSRPKLYRRLRALGLDGGAAREPEGASDQDSSPPEGTTSSDSSTFQ